MPIICVNGQYFDSCKPVLLSDNRAYRYGDGFFETILIKNNIIPLEKYHRKRIGKSFELLDYKLPTGITIENIFENIFETCKKNNCTDTVRVRLSFSNGNGGLLETEQYVNYLIEVWPINYIHQDYQLKNLKLGIYKEQMKYNNFISNLKTSSALLFCMASRFAQIKGFDDCIILNHQNNICETTIANIFWIKNNTIFTPPLSEGCVNGVLRTFLLESISNVYEKPCTENALENADEVFLTNAIKGIQPVAQINNKTYVNHLTLELLRKYIRPLFG